MTKSDDSIGEELLKSIPYDATIVLWGLERIKVGAGIAPLFCARN